MIYLATAGATFCLVSCVYMAFNLAGVIAVEKTLDMFYGEHYEKEGRG